MWLTQFHSSLANTVILFMGACGVWALFSSLRGGLSGSLLGALVIGEGLILFQGLLGVILLFTGARAAVGLHWLYGASAAVTLPGIYFLYARNKPERYQAFCLAAGAFFIVGLAIRGITTGL